MNYIHRHRYVHLVQLWGKTKDEILGEFPVLAPDYVDHLIAAHDPTNLKGCKTEPLQHWNPEHGV